jgi:hypothetical protein
MGSRLAKPRTPSVPKSLRVVDDLNNTLLSRRGYYTGN